MDDVIILGKLDKKELEKSIDELVNYVADKTTTMAGKFETAMDKMKSSMKDFAVTQKVSVDLMKEAWSSMSQSFDAMVSAQNVAHGGGTTVKRVSNLGVDELKAQITALDTELKALNEKSKEFISIRDKILDNKSALRQARGDVAGYEYRIASGENLSKLDMDFYEDAKKKVVELERELKSLLSQRFTIPAPSKEDIERTQELQTKLAELKAILDRKENTVGGLKEQIRDAERLRDSMHLNTTELSDQNKTIADQKALLKDELMTEEEKRKAIEKQNEALERQKEKQLKKAQSPYLYEFNKANTESSKDIASAEQKLKHLKKAVDDMRKSGLFDEVKLNKAQKSIDTLEQKIERMRSKRPMTLKDVLGMDESSVDAVARKMQALKRVSIDPKNAAQVRELGNEYQRLSRLQAELLGKGIQLTKSNNYLAQSFGYIRNRVVYALTLGAVTSFVKQVYEVRSQYELLERSLGVLVNSFQNGSQIFQELNSMALKSPFTLMELAGAAKQLTAYNFEAKEVVNTTRRLADLSAALGVPMERLTYNLGQIRAQTVLTARDARDFANAGLPIVKSLADYFTELEGRVVSTGDVYARMSKKMVSYNDVMAVLNKMTDEGGKFFDFQAKQAETLRVQLANLNLAWNNMLNAIGETNQGLLTMPITGLKALFQNWQTLNHVITAGVVGLGAYKVAQLLVSKIVGQTVTSIEAQIWAEKRATQTRLLRERTIRSLTDAERIELVNTRKLTAADYERILSERKLSTMQAMRLVAMNKNNVLLQEAIVNTGTLTTRQLQLATSGNLWRVTLTQIGYSMGALLKQMKAFAAANWWMFALSAIYEVYAAWDKYTTNIKELNRAVADSAKESFDSIGEFINNYQNVYDRLYSRDDKGNIMPTNIDSEEAEKAWEAMRGEIIESVSASDNFITKLESIEDVNDRLRKGFDYLQKFKQVEADMHNAAENAVTISSNLFGGLGGEGLKDDIKDYVSSLEDYVKVNKDAASDLRKENAFTTMRDDLNEMRSEIEETTSSMFDYYASGKGYDIEQQREVFERYLSQISQKEELSTKEYRILRMRAEDEYYTYAKQQYENQLQYAVGKNKQLIQQRLKDLEEEFHSQKATQETFFTWLSERQAQEVQRRLGNMSKEEISHIDWSKGEWKEWAEKLARDFSNEYGVSFNGLANLVKDANTWKINIPVYFNTIGQTPSDIVADYEERTKKKAGKDIQNAKSQAEVIKTLQDQEDALAKKIETARKAGGSYYATNKDAWETERKNLADQIHAYNSLTKAEENAQKAKDKKKTGRETKKDVLGDALQKEIQLVTDIQKLYKEYQKAGVDAETAKVLAAKEYNKTLAAQNATLRKFNIRGLTGEQLASMDLRQVRDYYQGMLQTATKLGNTKGVEALEKALRGLNEEITKIDYKKITEGLNNELGKLKDEYELAIELDASPELGDMFADMFQIDMESLPRSFGEALDRAQQIIDTKLSELNVRQPFDLLRTQIESIGVGEGKTKGFAELAGLDMDSEAIKGLLKWQQTFRDMFKKNITETEKMLDDYVKKYGGYADRMAEIEADRLQKVKRLNEAYYTEEMRRLPEYVAKMQAIEKGAEKERGKVKFDEFKDSRLYVAMFENLEYASTATLEAIREKLQGLKKDMGQLTPEQLKQVTQQFEKIDRELLRRNPFKGLIRNAKEYAKALGADGKKAQETFRTAQRKYDWELGTLATLKEQLEQKKAQEPLDVEGRKVLEAQVSEQQEKVDGLKEELVLAEKLNDEYNMMRILFGEQAKEIAKTLQTIAANLQSLGELRDTLQNTFGFEFSHSINGAIDALTQVGNGLSKITSSAQSGDAVGVVTGVVTTISGIGDTIASIFGDGAARTRRINREIENSVEVVRRLNMAYKELERQVTHAMGAEELRARRSQIENKKAQLAELERQMQLEQSKRSKDRDDDAIKQYEESIQDLRYEIADLVEDITNTLLGSDLKGASEEFVSVWVDAWRQGGDTMDALKGKFDDMIDTMIAKSLASSLVSERLEGIWKAVKDATSDLSEGGVDITMDELQRIRELIGDKTIAEQINDDLTKLYGALNIAYGSGVGGGKNLSALQQGLQGITEETAGALEAMLNGMSQQIYLHSDLLTQIRDTLIGFDMDVQTGALSQILLQLQSSYQVQMSIHGILEGVLNPSGRAFNVELLS